MSRKHCTKHNRSLSNYKKRLKNRGLNRAPQMTFTGMSTDQIAQAFRRLPHYKWKTVVEEIEGRKYERQMRVEI